MSARLTKKHRRVEAVAGALRGARHVAIVRLGSIGDVVATVPIAWFLRDLLDSGVKITWIVHDVSAGLLRGVGAIDEVVSIPKGSLLKAIPTWKKLLADREFDAVLDVHGNLKSGLVSLLTGARKRVGFHRGDCREHWNPLFTNLRLPRLASNNKTRRAIEIAELLGHPAPAPRFDFRFDAAEKERADEALGALEMGTRPLAILQLGRAEDIRSWPPNGYAALSRQLLTAGYSVLVLGGPPEEDTGRQVRGLLGEAPRRLHFEINTLTLREVGALFSLVAGTTEMRSVFVGGDSGCLHLAAGCGLRSIGLFGPQDPGRTAPVGEHVEVLYHPEVATCIPCARRECFHRTWSFCMKSISTDEVAHRVLQSVANGRPVNHEEIAIDQAGDQLAAPPERDSSRSGAPVPPAPDRMEARSLFSGLGREVIWVLLLSSIVLALRSMHMTPLAASSRFPGLARLLDSAGWPGQALDVLSGVGLVVVTYLMGRRLGSPETGLLAATLLPGTALFLDLSETQPAGGLFALLVNLCLLLFLEGEVRVGPLKRWCGPLSAVSAFVAFLVHGVLGALLPAFAIVAFRAGEKALGQLFRPRALATAALVAAGVAVSFFVMRATVEDAAGFPAAFLEPLTRPPDTSGPFWSYAEWLALWCLPASALAPFALFAHLKNRRYREDLGFADRRWRYSKIVFLSGFVLISVLPGKSPLYLLALLPALGVLSAAWLEKRWHEWAGRTEDARKAQIFSWLLFIAGALTLGALVVVSPVASRGAERWILAALFVVGWLLASRVTPTTTRGLSLRLVLAAVVTAAALR